MTPVAWQELTLKPRPSRPGLCTSAATTTSAGALYATSPCAVFRLCAAAYASSSDVRTCLTATSVSDNNGSVIHSARPQSRIDRHASHKAIDGVVNSLWPVPLSRYLSSYETPSSVVAAPQSTSSTDDRPLVGVALSTWFNLQTAQVSIGAFFCLLPGETPAVCFIFFAFCGSAYLTIVYLRPPCNYRAVIPEAYQLVE
ncbi:unnamed protein product [Schistocephalus solidus]|uniref:Uncharacterized protein n=1 Tax=Schistocephalus solidus TaxID=70667 RepID=A0A183SAK1_SCHSO|nr:unnamed protein product [Schistocephalus solidus]